MSSQLQPLTSIERELAERLEKDEKFRNRYLRRWAQNEVATEIRELRKKRTMRQAEVAALAKTGQSAISRIEKAEYDGWTFKTLMNIAEALHARLRITFEPIEAVVGNHGEATDAQLAKGGSTKPDGFGAIGRTYIGAMAYDDSESTSNQPYAVN